MSLAVGENIGLAPAHDVEPYPRRQESETFDRQRQPPLALQHHIELVADRMEMQHVGGGVGELGLAELRRAPIRGLLLLRDLHVEKLAREILQAVPVGVGAGEFGGYLRAVNRAGHDTERLLQDRYVKT